MNGQINDLPMEALRAKMREHQKPRSKAKPVICWHCDEHIATDVHHVNGNHKDNRPGNLAPYCKRCHNEVHGISDNLSELTINVRQFYDIQRQRMAMANRIRAYEALRYEVPHAHEILEGLVELETKAGKIVAAMVKREPIYQAYLDHVKGIGPMLSAVIISEMGDPGRFPNISSLWSYCGLSVQDGEARRRRKGEKANWNSVLRTTCAFKLPGQFIKKTDCFGRKLYDQYKAYYTERDGEELSKGHINNRAKRKVGKVFLSCLWLAWRELKGLPVTEPYAFGVQGGHHSLVTPQEWMENGGNGEFVWMEEMNLFGDDDEDEDDCLEPVGL